MENGEFERRACRRLIRRRPAEGDKNVRMEMRRKIENGPNHVRTEEGGADPTGCDVLGVRGQENILNGGPQALGPHGFFTLPTECIGVTIQILLVQACDQQGAGGKKQIERLLDSGSNSLFRKNAVVPQVFLERGRHLMDQPNFDFERGDQDEPPRPGLVRGRRPPRGLDKTMERFDGDATGPELAAGPAALQKLEIEVSVL